MTDTKTSAFTAASSPLTGSEVVTGVQSGSSVKITTQQIANLAYAGLRDNPGGRLTLVSNTPVLASDQTAKTAVYYTPYVNDYIPIYSGTVWGIFGFTEQTLNLDTTNHVSGSLYDVFVWSNSGTLNIGTGPAWSSTTARGTGAGTTELQMLNGLWTNKNSITLKNGAGAGTAGIPANTATYVGTIYCTANGQTGMAFQPTPATGGTNNILGVYNAYNRVTIVAACRDNTSTAWNYATTTWRASNNSNSNRVSFIDGLQQSLIRADFQVFINSNNAFPVLGMCLDSTSANPNQTAQFGYATATTISDTPNVSDCFMPQLGFHYIQAMEATTSGTAQFLGSASAAPTRQFHRLQVELEM